MKACFKTEVQKSVIFLKKPAKNFLAKSKGVVNLWQRMVWVFYSKNSLKFFNKNEWKKFWKCE